MRALNLHPKYIITDRGDKTSVILSIEEFETILEDFQDLIVVAERKDEEVISHKDFLNELGRDGFL